MTQKNETLQIAYKTLNNRAIPLLFRVRRLEPVYRKMKWLVFSMTWGIREETFEIRSFTVVQTRFRKQFKSRQFPHKSRIHKWIQKFRGNGTILNLNAKDAKGNRLTHSERGKSSRTPFCLNYSEQIPTQHQYSLMSMPWVANF